MRLGKHCAKREVESEAEARGELKVIVAAVEAVIFTGVPVSLVTAR